MRQVLRIGGLCALLLLAAPTLAVSNGWAPPPAPAGGDEPFAHGYRAFEAGRWDEVIRHMQQAIERRPWHDEAHNLLGYAYRKLGDYPQALEHYRTALELNPHNLGAMEYLGEAYLELDQPDRAGELLRRLEAACRRGGAEPAGCEPWQELKAAVDGYRPRRPR